MITQLGFFRSMHWLFWMTWSSVRSWMAWPQPEVKQFGKYYVVSFTIKNTRCKLICKEGPYIIDVMEDTDTSVRDELYPYFHIVPIDPTLQTVGKKVMLYRLGSDEPTPAVLPTPILGLKDESCEHCVQPVAKLKKGRRAKAT